jgi:hypothetical protein
MFNLAVNSLPDTGTVVQASSVSETFLYSNPLLVIVSEPAVTLPAKTAEVCVMELAGKVVATAQFCFVRLVVKRALFHGSRVGEEY